jgi:hypothetical protein
MKRLAAISVIFMLLPVFQSFSQTTDTQSTLGVKLTSTAPFIYKDEQGYTIVIGEVENTKNFAVNNVKIWVGFYSQESSVGGQPPLETVTADPILEEMPPYSKSPFMIKSKTSNPDISEVKVNIVGLNSASSPKQQLLQIEPDTVLIGESVKLSAKITNNAKGTSTNTKAHLIAFDAFIPPRIVGIQTLQVDDIESSESTIVKFDTVMDYRASSFKVVLESDQYQSKTISVPEVSLETLTRLITINSVDVVDSSGVPVSQIKIGAPVNITSELAIQYSAVSGPEQSYVYYAQVRQFGEKATVEHIAITEGAFESAEPQTVSVSWIPEHEGGFFIETYVWDADAVPLAAPSKTVSVVLVTP